MTTKQPESLELRLNRLETIFADMGDVVRGLRSMIFGKK